MADLASIGQEFVRELKTNLAPNQWLFLQSSEDIFVREFNCESKTDLAKNVKYFKCYICVFHFPNSQSTESCEIMDEISPLVKNYVTV